VSEIIKLTEIPAPPFKEDERGRAYLQMLSDHGLSDVERDPEGNVMGIRKGNGGGPLLAILAHLDTVFPEGTNVKVRREGNRLYAPGVGDDSRGLALLLAIIRAMDAAKFQTASDILFVGNVGEEGEGDLRGVRYLLQEGKYKDKIKLFIAIDGGSQDGITNGGVGSRRYRVTFKGPGGHSYGAFGLVSPSFAMSNAVQKFSRIQVPEKPKTTFNVGVIGGGTSVNSIPFESWMLVDMRSESKMELDRIGETFIAILNEAVDEENKARSTAQGRLTLDVKLIGDRPVGETPSTSRHVQFAAETLKAFGMTPRFSYSSTDSNIPIAMGIPAMTMGRGPGGRNHSPDEYTDVEKSETMQSVKIAMTIVLAVAGAK
jgi:acetylornithine deacetylase/succinyl-diaminopimelate desuccinylase-like protein